MNGPLAEAVGATRPWLTLTYVLTDYLLTSGENHIGSWIMPNKPSLIMF